MLFRSHSPQNVSPRQQLSLERVLSTLGRASSRLPARAPEQGELLKGIQECHALLGDCSGQLLDPVCSQYPSFISFKVLLEFQSLRILELEASGHSCCLHVLALVTPAAMNTGEDDDDDETMVVTQLCPTLSPHSSSSH